MRVTFCTSLMLRFFLPCTNIGSHPTVLKQVVYPEVRCKPWEKSARGKCVCKMPFECRYLSESLLGVASPATSFIGSRLRLSAPPQAVSESVRHLPHDLKVSAPERVPNARTAVHGQALRLGGGRRLRVARARRHHGLRPLPHVGVLRRYGGSW